MAPSRGSSGCDAPDPAFARRINGTINSGGVDRQYKLIVPNEPVATEPMPLVLGLHGRGSGMDGFARMSQIEAAAERERFVAIVPQGLGDVPMWDLQADGADVTFLNDVLDTVERNVCIDTAREYVTGFSMGAMMTTLLSCIEPERFAAAAPVAGLINIDHCNPAETMPLAVFHGTDDRFIRFEGGLGNGSAGPQGPPSGPSISDLVARWSERNGCGRATTETTPAEGVRFVRFECPAGADVEFYVIDRAGHTWPGSEMSASFSDVAGPTNMNLDATDTIWAFFQEHARS
jgi:polyhydroxybutyrate depolymerase